MVMYITIWPYMPLMIKSIHLIHTTHKSNNKNCIPKWITKINQMIHLLVVTKNNMNKNKKIALLSVVVIIIIGIFISNKNTSMSNTATNEKIKVGVLLPLTGPLAEYGQAYKNGITLASEKSGNKNTEYIFEDSDYIAGKSISAFNKLTGIDKVDVLMSWGGVPSDAVYPLLKDKKLPFLAGSSLSRVTESSPYTIRVYVAPDYFTREMWKYFRAHNYKNIAVVKVEALYPNTIIEGLIAGKNADETITVVDTYASPAENDFKTSILKLKNSKVKYDALGVMLFAGQIGNFYNQKSNLGLDIPTFGTDFFESKSDIDVAGKNIDGATYANFLVSDTFEKEYVSKFGNDSQISQAGLGYDMALKVNQLASKDPDQIMKQLRSADGWTGAIGSHKFVETANDRYFDSEVSMKVIQGGKIMKAN